MNHPIPKAKAITLFWSFRSPYSYLVMPRLLSIAAQHGLNIDLRVVHPNILRNPNYFKTMNPLARPYFMRDTQRTAEFLGMPFRRPVPDPIVQDPITLEASQDQPMARWLGRLALPQTKPDTALRFVGRSLSCFGTVPLTTGMKETTSRSLASALACLGQH